MNDSFVRIHTTGVRLRTVARAISLTRRPLFFSETGHGTRKVLKAECCKLIASLDLNPYFSKLIIIFNVAQI